MHLTERAAFVRSWSWVGYDTWKLASDLRFGLEIRAWEMRWPRMMNWDEEKGRFFEWGVESFWEGRWWDFWWGMNGMYLEIFYFYIDVLNDIEEGYLRTDEICCVPRYSIVKFSTSFSPGLKRWRINNSLQGNVDWFWKIVILCFDIYSLFTSLRNSVALIMLSWVRFTSLKISEVFVNLRGKVFFGHVGF